MPKYRLLTTTEASALQPEFIEYLIVNGIAAEDWERMKTSEPDKAEKVFELFSDVIFESILRKTKFLEDRGKDYLRIFQCLPDKMVLVALEADEGTPVDFTDPAFLEMAVSTPPESIRIYTSNKNYSRIREEEIFEMLQTGCVITDDRLFKTLCLVL